MATAPITPPAPTESAPSKARVSLSETVRKAFADYDEAVEGLRANGRMTAPERKP